MEKLTNERFAEIIRDKEICEFCADCGNDEICINCEKVNPATVAELRLFWKELSALVKARDEGRVVPCKVGDTIFVITDTFNGKNIVQAIETRKIERTGGNKLNPIWVVSTEPYELHFFPVRVRQNRLSHPRRGRDGCRRWRGCALKPASAITAISARPATIALMCRMRRSATP